MVKFSLLTCASHPEYVAVDLSRQLSTKVAFNAGSLRFDCFLHPTELIAHNPSLESCKKVPLMRLVCVTLQDIVLNKRVINYPLAIELLEEVPNLCPHIQFDFQFGSLLVDMKSQVCV